MTISLTGNATSNPMVVGSIGVGTLTITGGPAETRAFADIGVAVAGVGTLTLTSAASLTITDASPLDNRLRVGREGDATLLVQAGSDIVVNGGEYASLDIASQATSVSTATFTGTGTTFTSNLSNSGIMVGYLGNATLNVLSGAVVKTLCFNAAYGANSDGLVIVSGTGSQLIASNDTGTWTTHATDGGFFRLGSRSGSNALLQVTSGGRVDVRNSTTQDFPGLEIGNIAGSYGKAIVDGAGSRLFVHTGGTGESPYAKVGDDGKGVLEIRNGGEFKVDGRDAFVVVSHGDGGGPVGLLSELRILSGGDANITGDGAEVQIGRDIDANGKLTVSGAGSTLNLTGEDAKIHVGQQGIGELLVSAGGVVTIDHGTGAAAGFDTLNAGDSAAGDGTMNITGSGSKLVSLGLHDEIVIGNEGSGVLNITAGGEMSAGRLFAGNDASGNAAIVVSGAGSKLGISGPSVFDIADRNPGLWLGNRGSATMTIASGGAVTVTGDRCVVFAGDGYGALAAGETGTLNIQAGGTLTIDHGANSTYSSVLQIGNQPFGTGIVNMSGAGAKIVTIGNNDRIDVGNQGKGTLNMGAGATITGQRLALGFDNSGAGAAVVDGIGAKITLAAGAVYNSVQREARLEVGANGNGTMTVRNSAIIELSGARAELGVGEGFDNAASGKTGTLTIQSGAKVTVDHGTADDFWNVVIGHARFGNGTLTLTGGGSELVARGIANAITVANSGTGVLNVQSGGLVKAWGMNVANGDGGAGTGTVNLNGASSKLVLSNDTHAGGGDSAIFGGFLAIARQAGATGTVNITGGAVLEVRNSTAEDAPNVQVAREIGSTGNLLIDGVGSKLNISQTGPSDPGAGHGGPFMHAGRYGDATVTVRNDAQINVTGEYSFIVVSRGHNSGTPGVPALLAQSEVRILTGADVTVTGNGHKYGASLTIGRQANANGLLTIDGTGSTLTLNANAPGATFGETAALRIGREGRGIATAGNGADVILNANDDKRAIVEVGHGSGALGALTITGAGSTLTINSTNTAVDGGSLIAIGRDAGSNGSLSVLNGGQAVNDLASLNSVTTVGSRGAAGADPAAKGVLTVDGNGTAGTLFDAGQMLVVGGQWGEVNATLANVNFATVGNGSAAALDTGVIRANLIAVASGGAISGNSTFDGAVTVNGGAVAPGASPGKLTITGALNATAGRLRAEVNGLTAGALYDQIAVGGIAALGNFDIDLTAAAAFNFADGNRIVLIDAVGALTVSNIALIDVTVTGEPSTLAFQIADEGTDLVFEALNGGTGPALVAFGAASTVFASATLGAGGNGTGIGGQLQAVKFYKATGLEGTAGNDLLNAAAATAGVTLRGLAGGDRLTGGAFGDQLDGSTANDILIGGDGFDALSGGDGDDKVYGQGGRDTVAGGLGNDLVYGGDETGLGDTLNGEAGADYIQAGNGDDLLDGGMENDKLYGEGGNDGVTGGPGNDRLEGGAGIDILGGGDGNDVMVGGSENDTLTGGAGADRLEGGTGDDIMDGGVQNDSMNGGTGLDVVNFEAANGSDTVFAFVNDQDTLRIDPSFGFANAAAVVAATIQSGAHARILLGGGNQIYLWDYLAAGSGNTIGNLIDDILIA